MSASLRDHFRKGAEHWNKFVETYEEELIDFELGTFSTDLNLSGYEFPVPVKFYGCTFKGTVRIEIAEFGSWVTFSEATFEKTLLIKNSTFGGLIDFESAKCKGALVIDECIFKYDARFDDLDVLGRFYISDSRFDGDVSLNELGAYGGLALSKNEFEKEVAFSGQFDREVMFLGNHFKRLVDFKDAFINVLMRRLFCAEMYSTLGLQSIESISLMCLFYRTTNGTEAIRLLATIINSCIC